MSEETKPKDTQATTAPGWLWFIYAAVIAVLLTVVVFGGVRRCSANSGTAGTDDTLGIASGARARATGLVAEAAGTTATPQVIEYDWSIFRDLEFAPKIGETYRIVFDKPDTTGWLNLITNGPMRYDTVSDTAAHLILTEDGKTVAMPQGESSKHVWYGYVNRLRIKSVVAQTITVYTYPPSN